MTTHTELLLCLLNWPFVCLLGPLSVQTLLSLFDLAASAVVIPDLYRILDIRLLAYLQ